MESIYFHLTQGYYSLCANVINLTGVRLITLESCKNGPKELSLWSIKKDAHKAVSGLFDSTMVRKHLINLFSLLCLFKNYRSGDGIFTKILNNFF